MSMIRTLGQTTQQYMKAFPAKLFRDKFGGVLIWCGQDFRPDRDAVCVRRKLLTPLSARHTKTLLQISVLNEAINSYIETVFSSVLCLSKASSRRMSVHHEVVA
jgi:hypothetical protein